MSFRRRVVVAAQTLRAGFLRTQNQCRASSVTTYPGPTTENLCETVKGKTRLKTMEAPQWFEELNRLGVNTDGCQSLHIPTVNKWLEIARKDYITNAENYSHFPDLKTTIHNAEFELKKRNQQVSNSSQTLQILDAEVSMAAVSYSTHKNSSFSALRWFCVTDATKEIRWILEHSNKTPEEKFTHALSYVIQNPNNAYAKALKQASPKLKKAADEKEKALCLRSMGLK